MPTKYCLDPDLSPAPRLSPNTTRSSSPSEMSALSPVHLGSEDMYQEGTPRVDNSPNPSSLPSPELHVDVPGRHEDLLAGQVPAPILLEGHDARDYMTGDECTELFIDFYLRHPSTSKAAAADFVFLMKQYGESIHRHIRGSQLQAVFERQLDSFRTMERELLAKLPTVFMDIDIVDLGNCDRDIETFDYKKLAKNYDTWDLIKLRGVTEFPRSRYGTYRYLETRCESYVHVADALEFILKKHKLPPAHKLDVIIGCDGVREAKSNKVSLEVVFLTALICPKHALPIRVGRSSYSNEKADPKGMIRKVVDEILALGEDRVNVFAFLGDKPGRGKITHLHGPGGAMCCEYCFTCGKSQEYEGPLVRGKLPTKMTFPYDKDTKLKSHEYVKHLMEQAQEFKTDMLGYKARSCLLDLPNFDIVKQVVVEYMHGVCIGMQKRLIQQCYELNSEAIKKNLLKYKKRLDPFTYLREARNLKPPSDFNRSCSRLEATGLKAEECRNYLVASSFVVITTLAHRKPLVYVQVLFTYLLRAYLLPEDEFEPLKRQVNLRQLLDHFQEYYQEIFPPYYWVYYSHCMAHLDLIREAGPLTLTSMFAAEGMFHWLISGICPGTTSIGKQGMQRIFARYNSKKHKCWKKIIWKPFLEGQRHNDSLAYTWDNENKTRHLWRVIESDISNETCIAREIDTDPYILDCPKWSGRKLDFSLTGVYLNKGLSGHLKRFHFSQFHGKAMIVNKVIVTLPRHFLQESN